MKSYDVIFVLTADDAKWAVSYSQNHPNTLTKIIAPTISAQRVLKLVGVDAYDYYKNPILDDHFFEKYVKKAAQRAQAIIKKIGPSFTHIQILGTPLLDILQVRLETDFMTVLYCHDYIKAIERTYYVQKYLVPDNSFYQVASWSPEASTFVYLCQQFFIDKRRIKFYKSGKQSSQLKSFQATQLLIIYKNAIKKIYYHIFNMLYELFQKKPVKKSVDILFFSAGLNLYYYYQVLPRLLRKYQLLILTDKQSPESEHMLRKKHIPFVPLASYWNKTLKSQVSKVVNEVKKHLQVYFSSVNINTLESMPLSLQKACMFMLHKNCDKYILSSTQQVVISEFIISQFQPKLVITTHDPGPSAVPFVYAAKKRQKKTLVLLHGWNDIRLGANHYSDEIIVWGDYIADWFRKIFNKQKKSIHVGGFPYVDVLLTEAKRKVSQKNISTSAYKTIGLLLTIYIPNTYAQSLFLEQLFASAQRNNFRSTFLIRTHQGQSIPELSAKLKSYPFRVEYDHISDLNKFIEKCDVVISWDTAAMFWPMILGKPLFYTTPLWGAGITPVADFKAAWIPKNADELFAILKKSQKNPLLLMTQQTHQRRFLRQVVGMNQQLASDRTYQLIKQILVK